MICRTIGDTPFSVIPLHDLRRCPVNVALIGSLDNIQALVIQAHFTVEEPSAFGTDARAIAKALATVEGWTCINVAADIAQDLKKVLERQYGYSFRAYGDIYYRLEQSLAPLNFDHPQVTIQLLSPDDDFRPAEADADGWVYDDNWADGDIVALAIVEDRVVATASMTAWSDVYADVGVYTHSDWRKQGISRALSHRVMDAVQARGLIPVWSTGEDNLASRRVAEKLGMTCYGKRIYLIQEETK